MLKKLPGATLLLWPPSIPYRNFYGFFWLLNFFFLMGSGTRSHKKNCFESKNHPLIPCLLQRLLPYIPIISIRWSVIEFTFAQKVAWDNLTVMDSFPFLQRNFYGFFNFLISSFWWVQGPDLIIRIVLNSFRKNSFSKLQSFRLQTT